ncbi:chloride intracellular channel exl-1-like [Lycorma delicatula]|uniref:chloride intracellular channel exl-1-like n=1 Tax=Lycorma delicatula TaxID=130591 RepID=UPI003F50E412
MNIDGCSRITIFYKAGYDDKCFGACHQSQRVLMLAELKVLHGAMPKFMSIPVNTSRPPESFRKLGLRLRVPALFLETTADSEPIDVADEIISTLENVFPGGVLHTEKEGEADSVASDIFSKFCYFIRGVSKDSSQLEQALYNLNSYLTTVVESNSLNANDEKLFLCGSHPSLLDCELLPKLHQLRVAASGIKGYEIPINLGNVWKYLHSAYMEPSFVRCCPPDSEVLVHWMESINSPLQTQARQLLSKSPSYSFSVPAIAKKINID